MPSMFSISPFDKQELEKLRGDQSLLDLMEEKSHR
jgi:hypothetical protein